MAFATAQGVVAIAAVEQVIAGIAAEQVGLVAAEQGVITVAAGELVLTLFAVQLVVTRTAEDRVLVVPTAPVIISTDMFGLTDELGELRAVAQLPSITPAVPVTFTLVFTRG